MVCGGIKTANATVIPDRHRVDSAAAYATSTSGATDTSTTDDADVLIRLIPGGMPLELRGLLTQNATHPRAGLLRMADDTAPGDAPAERTTMKDNTKATKALPVAGLTSYTAMGLALIVRPTARRRHPSGGLGLRRLYATESRPRLGGRTARVPVATATASSRC